MSLLLQRAQQVTTTPHKETSSDVPASVLDEVAAPFDPLADLKFKVHERLIKELDPAKLSGKDRKSLRADIEEAARTVLSTEDIPMARQEKVRLVSEIADEVLGLGPLEPLLDDPTITEIMVNGPDKVFFEREGRLFLSDRVFRDDSHITRVIEKIVAPLGRRIDDSCPMVDARLADGSRVNAVIPPLTIDGPVITIRKFARDPLTVEDLVSFGTIAPEMVDFLRACVQVRLNTLISGGTGSGKTTLLNVLSSFIPSTERIITIEDPAELQLQQRHVIRMETKPANIEGRGAIAQRELVRNALRMRPDRIIVGEVRAGEAFDMLQAMNTGHDGSLTTVHANSPRDALARIENMVLMSGMELPVRAIREQVSSALHLVLQLARLRDGTRRVVYVTEVVGMEGQTTTLQDIFVFQQAGVDKDGRVQGRMRSTGLRPKCTDRFEQAGIHLSPSLFMPERM